MNKSLWWKLGSIFASFLLAMYWLTPTIYLLATSGAKPWEDVREEQSWAKIFPKETIKLGLDLQGGIHLVLSVEIDKYIQNEMLKYASFLSNYLQDKKIPVGKVEQIAGTNNIAVYLVRSADAGAVKSMLAEDFARFTYNQDASIRLGAGALVYSPLDSWLEEIRTQALNQTKQTIENRIDQFSVSEPHIATLGSNRILVQLPGMSDPDRALSIIRKTALLEFKLVSNDMPREQIMQLVQEAVVNKQIPAEYSHEDVNRVLQGKLPAGTEVLFEVSVDPTTRESTKTPYLLHSATLLTGSVLEDARVRTDPSNFNNPYVSLQMNEPGAEIFDKITTDNVGRQLAIVLDNKVASAPTIQDRIPKESAMDGRVSITLNSMQTYEEQMKEAEDLMIVLRAGSLPAPVEVEENRSVGPTLGRDSINSGMLALLSSTLLILVFMMLYYKFSGLVANLALFLNVVFLLAAMAMMGATLTLPGIAGIVLTIGMAVDANIIINERIREELRTGKTPRAAIETGYEKANITIFDSNITTIIAGVVLLEYGSGPIQGFAVTLIVGLITSYVTALWVTRAVFQFVYERTSLKKLSI